MTKYSLDPGQAPDRSTTPLSDALLPPARRGAGGCNLYAPGHQIHYKHQGDAVHSPVRTVHDAQVDGSTVLLILEDGTRLVWWHHDPERLTRILELLRGKCVVYPDHHALRIGPYWFNCATENLTWQECRISTASRPT